MASCYDCKVLLTPENQSCEHILQNSVGGRLKAHLLCHSCNSALGAIADAALAASMNIFANMLNIKRENGVPQPIEGTIVSTGERIFVDPGGKARMRDIKVNIEKHKSGIHYNISAPDLKTLKRHLLSWKRKFPKLDIDVALSSATNVQLPFGEQFRGTFDFGDQKVLQAVAKAALNFYLFNNGDRDQVEHLLPFIKSGQGDSPVAYFYSKFAVFEEKEQDVLHHMLLVGNPDDRTLYCLISYFGTLNYIVLLNGNYTGSPISFHHTLNPMLGYSEPRKVLRFLTRSEIENALAGNEDPGFERGLQRLKRFLGIASIKQATEQEFERIVKKTFDSTQPRNDEPLSKYAMRVTAAMESDLLLMIAAASKRRREENEAEFRKRHGLSETAPKHCSI